MDPMTKANGGRSGKDAAFSRAATGAQIIHNPKFIETPDPCFVWILPSIIFIEGLYSAWKTSLHSF